MKGTEWLLACAALAAGEYAASLSPGMAEAWPVVAVVAVLLALAGYGFAWPRWHLAFLFVFGAAIFLFASVDSERHYRLKPWMRNAPSQRRASAATASMSARNSAAAPLRRELSRRVAIGLDHEHEVVALNRAILLGERSRLSPRMRRTFVESGTIHVFAISGLHVMAVAGLIYWLLRIMFVPLRVASVAVVPILWGYVWVVGLPPSAVRAALMATFYYAAMIFWRKPDATKAWVLAFFVVYLVDPTKICDVGCALSFTVMLAIILALECGKSIGGALTQTIWVTFAAWAAGVPIVAHVFGRVTPGGLLANLALLPSAAVTVIAGALGLVVSFVSEPIAAHLNNLSALFTNAMVGVSSAVARLPWANIETGVWPIWACLAWYAALLSLLFLARLHWVRRSSWLTSCRGASAQQRQDRQKADAARSAAT